MKMTTTCLFIYLEKYVLILIIECIELIQINYQEDKSKPVL